MKKPALISILLVILVFTISCKKDDDAGTKSSYSAKVEGTVWNAVTIAAIHSTGGNTTTISASGSAPSEQIVIYYKGSGTGTFEFNDDNMGSVVVGNYVFSSMFSSTPVGQIKITKYDEGNKLISGTFSFDGEDIYENVYHVTEGKFENVSLIVN
jgi:hypothetical protein